MTDSYREFTGRYVSYGTPDQQENAHFDGIDIPEYCSSRRVPGDSFSRDFLGGVQKGVAAFPRNTHFFSSSNFGEEITSEDTQFGFHNHRSTLAITPEGRGLYTHNREKLRAIIKGDFDAAGANYLASGNDGDVFLISLDVGDEQQMFVVKMCMYNGDSSSYFTPGIDQMNLLHRLSWLTNNFDKDRYMGIYEGLNIVVPSIATLNLVIAPYISDAIPLESDHSPKNLFHLLHPPPRTELPIVLSDALTDLPEASRVQIIALFESYIDRIGSQWSWHNKHYPWQHPYIHPNVKDDFSTINVLIKIADLEELILEEPNFQKWKIARVNSLLHVIEAGAGLPFS